MCCYAPPVPRAEVIARQIRSGVSGMSMWRTPKGRRASTAALTTAARAPTVPASPAPLTPRGFIAVGTSLLSIAKDGMSLARGIAFVALDHGVQGADAVGLDILAGQHREDTCCAPRGRDVHAANDAMGNRRARHDHVALIRERQIVGVLATPLQQTVILTPGDGPAGPEFTHPAISGLQTRRRSGYATSSRVDG